MYHNIGEPPEEARLRGLYVRTGAFARQMWLLKMLGYKGLSMSEAMPYLRGEKSGRVVAITFDDGYLDTLEQALPVLNTFGFTATCYVVSGGMGGFNEWDSAELNVHKKLMSAEQAKAWQAAGMEVGAHSRTHPRLTKCTDEELQAELAGSRADLEALTGASVTQFCYPYGDLDTRVADAVRKAGYSAATTTQRGRACPGDNPMLLRRILVSGSSMLYLFLIKLLTRYEDKRG
jgi:peptidoglycan/xylan/chitin deacetylase (PgdA/CDA1 family)